MAINKTTIKQFLGISSSDYDTQIDLLIPMMIEQLTEYCNDKFASNNNESVSIVFTSTTIALTTTLPLTVGDFFLIYGSKWNDGIYQVKTYTNGVITIESSKVMRTETIECQIDLCIFPQQFLQFVSEFAKTNIVQNSNVSEETIDDYSIRYFTSSDVKQFVQKNSSSLNKFRKMYKVNYYDS
jgi:hypothetical protein